jgi:NitT/TauT family transport system substrate-binding protein
MQIFFKQRSAMLQCGALSAMAFVSVMSGASAQSSTPADTTKLVIGEGSSGISQVPIYVAEQEGFFKKAGLDVEGQKLNGGTGAAMAAFANNSVNILNLSAPELIQYTGNKVVSGKAFAEVSDQTNDVLAAKGIKDIHEIKGKTVGVSALNAGDYIYLVATMRQYGISPNDVTFITSGNPINRVAAIAAGTIQFTAATNSIRDEEAKAGTVLIKSGDNPVQFPINTFIASDDLIKNHKPLLKTFVKVMQDTVAWMHANPAGAAADCVKATGATQDVCAAGIAFNFDRSQSSPYTWSSTFAVNVEGIKSALAVMAVLDPTTVGLTVDDVVDTSIAGTTP